MVRLVTLQCPECSHIFDFNFDGDEFREHGGAECPECGFVMENLNPDLYLGVGHKGEDLSIHKLTKFRCTTCEEVFGVKPEFSKEVNCPYCGVKLE